MRWAARRGEDASHQLLQPNSCHEHPGEPTLSSTGLAPCRLPLPGPPLFAGCFAGAGTILSVHGGAERPRGPSDLEWRRAWHRSRQLEPVINLPPSGPWPGLFLSSRRASHSALSALHEVADQTPDTPCRAALPTRPSVAERVFDGTKSPFHRRHANAAAFRARSVFHRRISHFVLPCWRVRGRVEPPRVHRALPPGPRFRHAFTRLQRARSKRLTGCSPGAAGPRAVRRFLQLCGSPSTTSGSPNPAGVCSEAEAPAPWVARPLRAPPARPSQVRGRTLRLSRCVPPRRSSRRANVTNPERWSRDPRVSVRGANTDLPQPDNDPDTPCRLLVPAEPG
jgi:hypothetical protein